MKPDREKPRFLLENLKSFFFAVFFFLLICLESAIGQYFRNWESVIPVFIPVNLLLHYLHFKIIPFEINTNPPDNAVILINIGGLSF